jgi:hypothetical protein
MTKLRSIFPSLPSGHTIFCDDIREEIGGKVTLVGVYSLYLYPAEIPCAIPKICLSIEYREEVFNSDKIVFKVIFEEIEDNIKISPSSPRKKTGIETVLVEMPVEIPPDAVAPKPKGFMMRQSRLNLQISPFPIQTRGLLKVRAYRRDEEIRLGTLIIDRAPPQEPGSKI